MDAVLNNLRRGVPTEFGDFIAYADDIACVIKGDIRSELLTYSEIVTEILADWCKLYKLKISDKKSIAIMFKGNLDERRLATIKIKGRNIQFVEKVKYLGVMIDKKLNFLNHAKYLRTNIMQH